MRRSDWQRYSTLLDEALELEEPARSVWLADLQASDAETASAIARLLDRETAQPTTAPGPLGERAGFEAALHAALVDGPATDAAQAWQSFGPWQVRRKLGAGGMGEVWLAERADALYEGKAAIKLLRNSGDASRLAGRFARERQALARLAHPGIARLLDAGIAGHQPYLVLEYVRGRPLMEHAQGASLAQRIHLALAIGRAVEYAHGRLIVHRDLKPSNVLVSAEGEVKLLDFGIASLMDEEHSEQTSLTGLYGRGLTLDYAAPEQIAGEHTGVGVDVFSLGVMLFELLTGERPFKPAKPGRAALEHAVLHQARPRPSSRVKGIPPDLDAVVVKALQKSPEDRYPTMAAFVADLERWLEHRPVLAAQRDWRRDSALWLRRNRLAAGLSAAVIVSLAGGLVASLWQSQRLEREVDKSQAVQDFLVSLIEATDISVGSTDSRSLRSVLDAGARRAETELVNQPDVQATLYRVLAKGYFAQSEAAIAETLIRKALPLTEQRYGRTSYEYADLLINLADAIYEFGQYDEACGYYAQVERLTPQLASGHEQLTIDTLNSLSACQAQFGALGEAVTLRERALALALQKNEGSESAVSGIVSDYGLALMRAGRIADAEAQFRRSMQGKGMDRQNINYAITVNLLSEVLIAQGRYAEAEPLDAEAEKVIRDAGTDTLSLAFNLRNRARRLHETGDTAAALPVLQEALTTLEAKIGPDAPNSVQMQSLMAQLLASAGRHDEALVLASAAEAKLRGKAPLVYGRVAVALGAVHVLAGRDSEAITTLEKVIAEQRPMLGPDHPHLGTTLFWLGLAQRHLQQPEAARTLAEAERVLALHTVSEQVLRRMLREVKSDT